MIVLDAAAALDVLLRDEASFDAPLITSERRLLDLPAAASPATIESRHGTRAVARRSGPARP